MSKHILRRVAGPLAVSALLLSVVGSAHAADGDQFIAGNSQGFVGGNEGNNVKSYFLCDGKSGAVTCTEFVTPDVGGFRYQFVITKRVGCAAANPVVTISEFMEPSTTGGRASSDTTLTFGTTNRATFPGTPLRHILADITGATGCSDIDIVLVIETQTN